MDLELMTARLTISTIRINDSEFIYKLVNSEDWLKFIGNRNVNSLEDAIPYIQKIKNTPNLTYWVVKIASSGEPIGIVSLIKREYLEHFDIGFAFLPEFGGNGYAYEAAHALFSEITKNPEFKTLLATTVPGNTLSIKLLTKLGMRFEKEIEVASKKLHVYSS